MKERRQKFFKARLPLRIILDWQYPAPHEQRGKDRNTQLPLQKTLPSRKSYWSVIVRLIFDSIGSRVQNKVMVQLLFGNRIKHLPCEFYTLWVIYFQLSPMFPLHVHLKAKSWYPTLHSRLQGRLPLAQVYCFSKMWCSREWFIFLCKKHVILLGGKTQWTVRSRQHPFSEPHECYCLGLFMCPPLLSLELCSMIA